MKYIVLLCDGFGGYPIPSRENKTTFELARTPNIDFLASNGTVGRVVTTPERFAAGSDVTNMNILGYDPEKYYTGRSPLEAANLGIEIGPDEISFRCNLVTLASNEGMLLDEMSADLSMVDYSAGHITTDEASGIVKRLDAVIDGARFYPGTSYRHLMVLSGPDGAFETTPPHDITGKKVGNYLPRGYGADTLNRMMSMAVAALRNDPVNRARLAAGQNPANSIWLWGDGKAPVMPSFKEMFGMEGAMISAVDLMKGLGRYAGFENIEVPGATGYLDSNFTGKADYALDSLNKRPFVYLHVEAADEAGHMGLIDEKIEAIEKFDKLVLGRILEGLGLDEEFRILLLCDHYTPIVKKTHTKDPVPFLIYDNNNRFEGCGFSEKEAEGGIFVDNAWKLMPILLEKG